MKTNWPTETSPRIRSVDPLKTFSFEDYNNPQPQFSFLSGEAARFQPSRPSTEPVNATLLFTRLRAIRAALIDIPRQARRLARWEARQALAWREKRPLRPRVSSTIRPGLPPGWRERRIHAVDDVLRECQRMAWYIKNRRDSG